MEKLRHGVGDKGYPVLVSEKEGEVLVVWFDKECDVDSSRAIGKSDLSKSD